ncbi:DNA-directed RNA polymerase I subunit RPA43 [Microdochium nivale]|nr:DNA-directed RNA polymerase I subunit RPA43 [Microdochium nivale]
MSAMVSDPPPVLPPGSDKKSKKAKKEHKTKKRDREPDAAVDVSERKSKKPKQEATPVDADSIPPPAVNGAANATDSKQKKDKKRARTKGAEQVAVADAAIDAVEIDAPAAKKEKKSKKSKSTVAPEPQLEAETEAQTTTPTVEEPTKKKMKRDRKSKDHDTIAAAAAEAAAIEEKETVDTDAMEVDSTPIPRKTKKSSKIKSASIPKATPALSTSSAKRSPPFYTQTVSLYLPLFPAGMTEPLEGYADQHLKLLVNHYVPDLKGILLAYRNPRLGERPGAKSLTENSSMEDVALLESISEYAVAFGWFTAEIDLFRPTRGAWMEGRINLQSEGFVGVICFDMFNASIEASRLPEGWRWVDLMSSGQNGGKALGSGSMPDPFNKDDNDETGENGEAAEPETEQLHSTGYWADATGARVTGTLPFRIKNYEVGSSDTHGYLSIEGTMLSEEDELARVLDEREEARRRKKRLAGGYLQRHIKRIPDFATTRIANAPLEQDEEDEAQRAMEYKGTVAVGDNSD